MQLYVIRHGFSEANAAGLVQGQSDSSLTDTGIAQAELLGRFFKRKGIQPDRIYSSPLGRAYSTAMLISDAIPGKPPVEKMQGLMEVDTGRLSGLVLEQAFASYPKELAPDVNRWLDFAAFDGESFDGFFARVDKSVREITCNWDLLDNSTFFFVTHAGVMRPLLKTLLDANSDFMSFSFGNCCQVKICYRKVRDSVRKVIEHILTIEQVAELMGEANPGKG